MSILDTLRFIKGAVDKKNIAVPVLTHFSIAEGVIRGGNGLISMGAPIPLSLSAQPLAIPFTKAIELIEQMEGAIPALSLTPTGRLTVAAGKFRVHIDCSSDLYPESNPEGHHHELQPGLLQAFKVLYPMIGEDASRPWCRGVLIREGSAYATNNIVIGQYWLGFSFPFDLNIPDECVREILRVKEDPVGISATDRSVTFFYSDGRWIRSQLLSTVWPNVDSVLNRPCNPQPLPKDFFSGLAHLEAYCDASRAVNFSDNRVLSTHLGVGDIGARFELDENLGSGELRGRYSLDMLKKLDGLVAECDWSLYPAPALGFGVSGPAGYPVFRFAIVGMRTQ